MKSIIFFGTPDFAVPTLQMLLERRDVTVNLVVTQPDKPAGRGQGMQSSAVKRAALQHAVPVYQPHSLRKQIEEFRSVLSELPPIDMGIVLAFGQILPQTVLDMPKLGCVNVHASLLPRWRGAAPIQRCLLAGDSETGITLMQMDAGLDTGPALAQARILIDAHETAGSLHDKLSLLGAECLKQHLPQILAGELAPTPQPESGATYAGKILPQEGIIDWQESAESIARKIRAFSPFPAAFTWLDGKRLKILAVAAAEAGAAKAATVITAKPGALVVACGSGSLEILELQMEGRKRMSAAEFLRGSHVPAGKILGS